MKRKLFTTIISTALVMGTLTACGETPAEPKPADPTPVAESPTPETPDADPTPDTPAEPKEMTPAQLCNEKLWYATKEWPVSPGWDEHTDVTCVQIADIFLWDGMTYEDLIAAFRNSEINKEINSVYLLGMSGEENGAVSEFEEGKPGFYAFPDTFDEWRQAYRENREKTELFESSGDNISVYFGGATGQYDDDAEHGYYYDFNSFNGNIFFALDYDSDDPYNRVLNEVKIEELADDIQRWIEPWEDGKSGKPVMEAITRFSKDQALTPLNFDEIFAAWDNIPESSKSTTDH